MESTELNRNLHELERGCIERRNRRIDRLVESAERRGEDPDRLFWSIVHDLEHAPMTTLRARLRTLGLTPPGPEEIGSLDSRAIASVLDTMLVALRLLGVFVHDVGNLPPADLLRRLTSHLVDRPIPDLPVCLGGRTDVHARGRGLETTTSCHPDLAVPRLPPE